MCGGKAVCWEPLSTHMLKAQSLQEFSLMLAYATFFLSLQVLV